MAGITLALAQEKLEQWMQADTAVAQGQKYTIGGREMTRADAMTIRQNIEYWDAKVKRLSRGGGIRVRYGVPC